MKPVSNRATILSNPEECPLWTAKLTYQNKLILHFTLIFFVVLTIAGLLFYTYTSRILTEDILKSSQGLSENLSEQLDITFRELDNIAVGMIANKELMNMLYDVNRDDAGTADLSAKQLAYRKKFDNLYMTVNTPLFISSRITLFHPDKGFVFALGGFSYDGSMSQRIQRAKEWTAEVSAAGGGRVIVPPHPDDWSAAEDTVFSLARQVRTTTGTPLGVLEVQKPLRYLQSIAGFDSDEWNVYIAYADGRMFYADNRKPATLSDVSVRQLVESIQSRGTRSDSFEAEDGSRFLYAAYPSEYTGLTTVVLRSFDEVRKPVVVVRNMAFAFGGLLFALSIGLVYIISRHLTGPIRKLRESVKKVHLHNLSLALDDSVGRDEMAQLNRSFDKMLQRLKFSIDETLAAKIAEAKSRLLAYQSQMTPHFLYNTLHTIGIVAEEADQEAISDMCGKLLAMLRYVSDFEESTVTLDDEVLHLRNYLALMKCRYEDRLHYEVATEGDLRRVQLPKLTLQPLAENSIQHGLRAVSHTWSLRVTVNVTADRWSVTVADNGSGFSEDALRRIKQRMSKPVAAAEEMENPAPLRIGGMGLVNTYVRLKLITRGEAELNVENAAEGGASVTIRGGG